MALQTPLNQNRDVNGYVVFDNTGMPFSVQNTFITLTLDNVSTVTVPSGPALSYTAFFKYSSSKNVWVLPASTPTLTLPTSTSASTLAQLNPQVRSNLTPGQTIQFLWSNDTLGSFLITQAGNYLVTQAGNALITQKQSNDVLGFNTDYVSVSIEFYSQAIN